MNMSCLRFGQGFRSETLRGFRQVVRQGKRLHAFFTASSSYRQYAEAASLDEGMLFFLRGPRQPGTLLPRWQGGGQQLLGTALGSPSVSGLACAPLRK